jgi:hypothetical protein
VCVPGVNQPESNCTSCTVPPVPVREAALAVVQAVDTIYRYSQADGHSTCNRVDCTRSCASVTFTHSQNPTAMCTVLLLYVQCYCFNNHTHNLAAARRWRCPCFVILHMEAALIPVYPQSSMETESQCTVDPFISALVAALVTPLLLRHPLASAHGR